MGKNQKVMECWQKVLDRLNDLWAEWSNGEHPNLRFGQLVCNTFGWTYPELFYEEYHKGAYAIAMSYSLKLCKEKVSEGES